VNKILKIAKKIIPFEKIERNVTVGIGAFPYTLGAQK